MKELKSLSKKEIIDIINKEIMLSPSIKKLKKLKALAMSKNIKLGGLKKRYCKYCYSLFTTKNSEIRIKKSFKVIKCKNCGKIKRYKIK